MAIASSKGLVFHYALTYLNSIAATLTCLYSVLGDSSGRCLAIRSSHANLLCKFKVQYKVICKWCNLSEIPSIEKTTVLLELYVQLENQFSLLLLVGIPYRSGFALLIHQHPSTSSSSASVLCF